MGWIRFLLAFLVLAYHCQIYRIVQTIGGLAAVEAFFFISGFYMSAAYPKYEGHLAPLRFWLSRYLRLYPFYIFTVIFTALFWVLGLSSTATPIFNAFTSDGTPWLSIVTLLGQDLISVTEGTQLKLPVVQAWSISAELAFYAMVPLLLKCRNGRLLQLTVLSFAIKFYFTATANWRGAYFPFYPQAGYFILGILLFRHRDVLTWKKQFATPMLSMASVYLCTSHFASFEQDGILPNVGLLVALALTMPTAFVHSNNRFTNFLGDISYGVYLVHMLVIHVLTSSGLINRSGPAGSVIWSVVLVLAFSVLVSAFFEVVVQGPVDRWRRRKFAAKAPSSMMLAELSAPVNEPEILRSKSVQY